MTWGFRTTVTAVKQPALRLWNRVPMRTQGRITVGLPLVAVFISACLAPIGNAQRVDIETDVQRKSEMSGALGDLTTLMVNAETGMRGHVLTGQGEFLEPSTRRQHIQHIRTLSDRQLDDLALQRSYAASGQRRVGDPETLSHLTYGKRLMDEIRVETDAMRDEEQGLLDDRIADINDIRERDYVSVAIALIAALGMRFLAWYLFRTGTLRRVERLTENVRSIRRGCPPPFPPQGKSDPLGELECEIHLIER